MEKIKTSKLLFLLNSIRNNKSVNFVVFTKKEIQSISHDGCFVMSTQNILKIEGIYPSEELHTFLQKTKEEFLYYSTEEGTLVFKGRRTKTKLYSLEEGTQPFLRKKVLWHDLPENFNEAVSLMGKNTKQNPNEVLNYFSIFGKNILFCDGIRASIAKLTEEIAEKILLPKEAIPHLKRMEPNKFGIGSNWLLFKKRKNILSIRKTNITYPSKEVLGLFKIIKKTQISFPEEIKETLDVSKVFLSSLFVQDYEITCRFRENECTFIGEGIAGSHTEKVVCSYSGPTLELKINPDFLWNLLSYKNKKIYFTKINDEEGKLLFLSKNSKHLLSVSL